MSDYQDWNQPTHPGAAMQKKPKHIAFEYRISDNYVVYASTGATGGLNAQGQIVISFFNERGAIPRKQTYEISDQGNLIVPPIAEEKTESVIRNVFMGVSLPASAAKMIGEWLIGLAQV